MNIRHRIEMVIVAPGALQTIGKSSCGILIRASRELTTVPVGSIRKLISSMGRSYLSKVSLVGLALSLYAIYVEMKKSEESLRGLPVLDASTRVVLKGGVKTRETQIHRTREPG